MKLSVKVILYDGHIRNWKALCEKLAISADLSKSDREKAILCSGYSEWKDRLPQELIGAFAFVLYIKETDSYFCARDHFGTIPLYYTDSPQNFMVSINIDEIVNSTSYKKDFDQLAIQNFLTFSYIAGENTVYKEVKKLMPGHILKFEQGKILIKSYWEPLFSETDHRKSLNDWAEEIDYTLKNITDEIVDSSELSCSGIFLSGGIDSAYLSSISRIRDTYTVGFSERKYNEIQLAEEISDLFMKKNHSFLITKEEFLKNTKTTLKALCLPIGTPASIAYNAGCRFLSESKKISLSGEGADEFFCGYDVYAAQDPCEKYFGKAYIMDEDTKKRIFNHYISGNDPYCITKRSYENQIYLDTPSRKSLVDISCWLEGNSLLNIYKNTSYYHISARLPIIDLRIFDIISHMPARHKVNLSENKISFRRAASFSIPFEIASRPKRGFVIPMRYWLSSEVYQCELQRAFNSEISRNLFNYSAIQEINDLYMKGNTDLWRQVWNIYILICWCELFFD